MQAPSRITGDYWVHAERKHGVYPGHTAFGGKWLIFVSARNIDRMWERIRTAVEEGTLGAMAKAATARSNPEFSNANSKVICVYTYDWRDEKDVKRIREALRNLGVARKIAYKADQDTESGRYHAVGEKLSKYYE